MGAKEAEMEWMIKGAASGMKWTTITDNVLFPVGVNSVVFTSFGLVPHFGVHWLVLRVCYARR